MANVNVLEPADVDKVLNVGEVNKKTALAISNACSVCEEDGEKVVCIQIKAMIHYWFPLYNLIQEWFCNNKPNNHRVLAMSTSSHCASFNSMSVVDILHFT